MSDSGLESALDEARHELRRARAAIAVLRTMRMKPEDGGWGGEDPVQDRPTHDNPFQAYEEGTHDGHDCEWATCADCAEGEDKVCACDAVNCEWCDAILCQDHAVTTADGYGCRYCCGPWVSIHQWEQAKAVIAEARKLVPGEDGRAGLRFPALETALAAYGEADNGV